MCTIKTAIIAVVVVKVATELKDFILLDGASTDTRAARKFSERTVRELSKLSEDKREQILDGPLRPSCGDFLRR